MHDRREAIVVDRPVDIGGGAAKPPGAGAFEPQGDGRHAERDAQRPRALQRLRKRRRIVAVAIRFLQLQFAGGNVDGAKATGQPALGSAWSVDMALVRAFAELFDRIAPSRLVAP